MDTIYQVFIDFMHFFRFNLSILVFYVTLSTQVIAEISVEVLDQHGRAVPQAVISTLSPLSTSTSEAIKPAVMDQVNKQFSPQVLVINKNDWVSFPNSDDIRHHVYSFSKPKPFEIRLFKGSESNPVQFDKPGVVVLGCNIHDQMVGYIYVADSAETALTDTRGLAKLKQPMGGFNVWHPRLSIDHGKRLQFDYDDRIENGIQRIVLDLLSEKPVTKKRSFQSKKFGRRIEN